MKESPKGMLTLLPSQIRKTKGETENIKRKNTKNFLKKNKPNPQKDNCNNTNNSRNQCKDFHS